LRAGGRGNARAAEKTKSRRNAMKPINMFWKEEDGQDLIEYSLLLGFVALFSVSIYTSVTGNISKIWTNASSALVTAGSGS
jgi:Flp pilus assembly pilin Flp